MHILDQKDLILDILEDLNWHSVDNMAMSWSQFIQQELKAKNDFLVVHLKEIVAIHDDLLSQLNSYTGVIVLYHKTDLPQFQLFLEKSPRILSAFELPLKAQDKALLSNQLQWLKTNLEEKKSLRLQMIKFSEEIDSLVQSAETEMLKAKRIHESVVPKRIEEFKGITLMSKYAVGSGAGSEYFDLIRGSHHSHLIVIHTDSYLASSSLMGLLNKYKGETQGIDFELFMKESDIEIKAINAHKKKPVSVEMLLLTVNHLDLTCYGYSFGEFDLISQVKEIEPPLQDSFELTDKERAYFEFQLEREEKVIVFSPGFIFNWNEQLKPLSMNKFVNERIQGESGDLLVELFFQLKKKLEDDFLSKDATVIVMEVKRYAIQKV